MKLLLHLLVVLLTAAPIGAVPLKDRDLPWGFLVSELSPTAGFVDETSNQNYIDQCSPEFLKQWLVPPNASTNLNLIAQPDGVCMNYYTCGYKECLPVFDVEGMTLQGWVDFVFEMFESGEQLFTFFTNPDNTAFNLPAKVLFPAIAGDVVAAVKFAGEHMVELSVKASGHHFAGASQKQDTLLLNMHKFKKYSPKGLVECLSSDSSLTHDLSNQPCLLALARNTSAYIRVGGGETWGDVYGAVKTFNEAQSDGYKYHATGGAAGTVTPMGWTWQGGLSGTTGGRTYGFGVDQVLTIEAVLPTGHHVRFGPTAWEDQKGYRYPRTTEVSGVCNGNPSEWDETKWNWVQCPDNLNFEDLWFAMLGGGGGTYGIVTSVYLQLQDYRPLTRLWLSYGFFLQNCSIPEEDFRMGLEDELWGFHIDFYLNPTVLGVTEEQSNECGGELLLHCYSSDGGATVAAAAWENYIISRKDALLAKGIPEETIMRAASCPKVDSRADYGEGLTIKTGEGLDEHVGKAKDGTPPSLLGFPNYNILIPKVWMLDNKDKAIQLLKLTENGYFAFGGATANAQDNSVTSLSDAHRQAGVMIQFKQDKVDPSLFWDEVNSMYDFAAAGIDNFPAYLGGNHYSAFVRGPLKSDLTKPCSVNFTFEERDEKCVSLQAAIYGSNLARLESIKEAIDPNYMLDCTTCVGNNRGDGGNDPGDGRDDASGGFRALLTSPWSLVSSCDISRAFVLWLTFWVWW